MQCFCRTRIFVRIYKRGKSDTAKIGDATEQATKILNNALSEAENTKKTLLLETKDEIHRLRSDADKEIRERRNEVQKQEKDLTSVKNILIKELTLWKRKMKV